MKEHKLYTAISRKVVGNNMHAIIPKGNMGYDQYTVPDTVAVEPAFVAFLKHSQTYIHGLSCHFHLQVSLKNFELKNTQYLSGLSRALFQTNFLEIAVQFNLKITNLRQT